MVLSLSGLRHWQRGAFDGELAYFLRRAYSNISGTGGERSPVGMAPVQWMLNQSRRWAVHSSPPREAVPYLETFITNDFDTELPAFLARSVTR